MRKFYLLLMAISFVSIAKTQTTAVQEIEPNNTPATATPIITNPAKISGNVFPDAEVDYYSFTATAGDRVYATVQTSFASNASFDADIRLIASDGTTVIEYDDADGTFGGLTGSIAGATIPSTGTYYIQVNHFSATNRLRGYDLYFALQSGTPTAEVESNDTPATANAMPASGWVSGARNPAAATEQDWFSVTLAAGESVFISADWDPERDNVQYNGRLGFALFGDANNQILVVDDASTGSATNPLSEAFLFTAKEAGTYYVFADAASAAVGGPTATYNISFSKFAATTASYVNYPSADIPKTIGPGTGSVTSTLTVADSKLIKDISVRLNLNHTLMADIDATLTSPNGSIIHLFSDIGAAATGGQTQMDLIFNDNAAIPPSFTVLRPVVLQPEIATKLNMFKGVNTAGTWTLTLYDDVANASGGTLNSWSIDILEEVPPNVAGATVIANEDFESSDGGFTHSGTADEWERGLPTFAPITTANSGTNCWKTDLDNTYNASSNQILSSPTYVIPAGASAKWLSWAMKHQVENRSFDSLRVYIEEVGNPANAKNLFEWMGATPTQSIGNPSTTVNLSAGWGTHWADISSFSGLSIQFKVKLATDGSVQLAGVAIDDFRIYDLCTAPTVTGDPTAVTVCSGATANFSVTATGTPVLTYQWQEDNGGGFANISGETNATLSFTTTATQNNYQYRCVVTNSCGNATSNPAILTVNNTPVVTADPTNTSVCDGSSVTFSVTATGTPAPTYQWQVDNGGGFNNIGGETNATYTFTATNAENGYQYRCVVTNSCGSVNSASATLTVTAAASATISYAGSPYCSTGGTATVTLTGSAGGTYSSTAGLVINASTGAVDLAASTAGTYTVNYDIAAAGTCPAFSTSTTITIAQSPTVNPVANQIVCNNGATAPVTFTGSVPTATYNWTNNDPSIGLAASGTGNIASFIATNAGTAPVTATITVTPTATTTIGSGTVLVPFNFTGGIQTWTVPAGVTSITIETNGAQGGTGAMGNAGAGGPAGGVGGLGARATGTLAVTPGQVLNIFVGGQGAASTGGFNGGGNGGTQNSGGGGGASDVRVGGTAPTDRVITAGGGGGGGRGGCEGSTGAPGIGGNGGDGGGGAGQNGNDSPTSGGVAGGGFGGNAGSVQGAGGGAGIGCGGFLGQPGITTSTETGAVGGGGQACCCFSFSSIPGGGGGGGGQVGGGGGGGGSAGTVGCSGNDKGAGGGGGGGSSYTGGVTSGIMTNGVNAGNGSIIISYTDAVSVTCTGTPETFTYTVNPTPIITPVANQTVCNGAAIPPVNFTVSTTGGINMISWTNSNPAIGIPASGTGNIFGFTGTNSGTAPISGTITVTPQYSNGSVVCTGPAITYTVTINPTATVNAVANQTVCNATSTTAVTFTSPTTGGTIVYNWTNNTPSIGLAASGTGNIAAFTATNTGTTPVTATITVTPTYTNGVACVGTPRTFTITVNPTPNAVATPTSQTICNTTAITPIVLTGAVSGTTFNWTRDNTATVTGIAASGSGNISGTLTNTTTAPVTVTFTITPTANGCPGTPSTATVVVNPTPTVNPVANQTVCNGSPTALVAFTSPVAGTTYAWTNNTTSIGLGASGTGNIPSFTATNATTVPVTATITVTPSTVTAAGSSPELFHYRFDGAGTSVPNLASAPPAGTATATIQGTQTQGGSGICNGTLIGSGAVSTTNFVNTNWATNLTGTSWTISLKTSNITPSATLFYIFGDAGAGSFRCFTNGVAGANNWLLRGPVNDVLIPGGATVAPHTTTFVYDNVAGNIRGYLDGVLVATVAQAAPTISGAGPFKVGGYGTNTGLPTGGLMDEFRIYNRALSAGEVAALSTCVGGTITCTGPSTTFNITVNPTPTITCPSNITVASTVGTCTAPVTYAPVVTGTPTPTLSYTFTGATTGSGSGSGSGSTFNLGVTTVAVTATNICGIVSCSFTVTVTDSQLPVITAQPQNRTVCAGTNATFNVTAITSPSAGGPLSYQWQQWNGSAWVNVSGATASSYTVTGTTVSMNTNTFRCVVTGLCTPVNSNAASLYVNPLPTISLDASTTASLLPPQSTTITATVNPPGGSFVWSLNGSTLAGVTGNTVTPIGVNDAGAYRAVYTDPNGCVVTSAILNITAMPSNNLWVYPVPNTGVFNVRYYNQTGEATTVKVYNAIGQEVYQQKLTLGIAYSTINVNIPHVPAGGYIVTVINSSGVEVGSKRIVIYHP